MMRTPAQRAPWLEADDEFEGVGAHELNPRYSPVDEAAEGYYTLDVAQRATPALSAARSNLIQSFAAAVAPPRFDGADISHYQYDAGPVDLAKTKAAPSDWFATKLTQSVKYVDPTGDRSRSTARTVGFRCVGMYHWLSSTTDPQQQAAWFLSRLGQLRDGEFVMLDDEESGVDVAKTLAWLEAVEAATKRPAAVYTGAYVNGGKIWQSPAVREGRYGPRPMILAAYTSEAKAKALPGVAAFPWSSWQYSSNGPVPGITGRCDMNRVDDWAIYDRACGRAASSGDSNHTDDLEPGPSPAPAPTTEDLDMAFIIHTRHDNAPDHDWWATIDAGYAIGVDGPSLASNKLPILEVSSAKWDEYIAVSDTKKAADRALAAGLTVNVPPVPPITLPPFNFAGTATPA